MYAQVLLLTMYSLSLSFACGSFLIVCQYLADVLFPSCFHAFAGLETFIQRGIEFVLIIFSVTK